MGILLGGLVTVGLGRFVESLVFGVEPLDPVSVIGAAGLLALVTALAAWQPLRRALRIDPTTVLRAE